MGRYLLTHGPTIRVAAKDLELVIDRVLPAVLQILRGFLDLYKSTQFCGAFEAEGTRELGVQMVRRMPCSLQLIRSTAKECELEKRKAIL